MTDDDKVKEVTDLVTHLKAMRQPYESLIDECIEYGFHSRRKITATNTQGGEKTGQTIYDSTAAQALELMGNGLYGSMLGPGWLKITLPMSVEFPRLSMMRQYNNKPLDEIPEVAKYMSKLQDCMIASIQQSNFYSLAPQAFKDGPCIGTMCMDSDYIIGDNKLNFTIPHFREIYICHDRYGKVDTRIRVYKISYKDCLEQFGEQKMKDIFPDWSERYKKNPYEKIEVTHAIYPRRLYEYGKITADNMAFVSRWIHGKKLLKDSGFPRFPSIIWEWMRNSDEDYARGAVANAINDIKMAQTMGKSNTLAGAKIADPPYAMMETLRGRNYVGPGGRTYLKNMETEPKLLDTNARALPYSVEFQDRIDKIIEKWMHSDVFMMMTQAMMENHNLREVQVYEMMGEKAMVMAPMTECIEKGFLNQFVDIVFDAEAEAGRAPQPPQLIMDIAQAIPLKMEVDYQGSLSLARKMYYKTRGINSVVQGIGVMAQIAPEVVKVPKWINLAKKLCKDFISPDDINTDEEISAQIEAEQAAIAEQNMMATAAGMADAVPKLSKPVEEGSVLSAMVGGK